MALATGALLLVLTGATPARADEPPGALRMRANALFLPTVGAEVALVGTLEPEAPLLLRVAGDLRGFPDRRAGRSWFAVDGSVTLQPFALGDRAPARADPVAFDARVALLRTGAETKPIVAAADARFGAVSVARDRLLGTELGGLVQVVDWTGGLYLPAHHPRDIDARLLVGARALGVRFRRYVGDGAAPHADFWGASIGGISGEVVYGRKLAPLLTLTGHLGARADWSVGAAEGFTALTDTEVWLGGVLDLGPNNELRVLAGTRTAEDDAAWAASAPTLSVGWRTTW